MFSHFCNAHTREAQKLAICSIKTLQHFVIMFQILSYWNKKLPNLRNNRGNMMKYEYDNFQNSTNITLTFLDHLPMFGTFGQQFLPFLSRRDLIFSRILRCPPEMLPMVISLTYSPDSMTCRYMDREPLEALHVAAAGVLAGLLLVGLLRVVRVQERVVLVQDLHIRPSFSFYIALLRLHCVNAYSHSTTCKYY